MDEAGTSPRHPVTVVAGIIIEADKALNLAEMLLEEALGAIPKRLGVDYEYSTKDIWGNPKYPEFWSMSDRIALIKSILRIPRRLEQGVGFAVQWGDDTSYTKMEELPRWGMKKDQYEHWWATLYCIGRIDRYIRERCGPSEIGMIVAEDHLLRSKLKIIPKLIRDNPLSMLPEHIIWSEKERAQGYSTQVGEIRVSRIRNAIHFVRKSEDKLVWIADAAAWALRAYFEDPSDKFGFCKELLGVLPNPRDFTGAASTSYHFGG